MDVERAARIAAIKNLPAWQELTAEIEETVARYSTALAKKMLSTGIPYEDFEYKRGYLAGLQSLVRYPDRATAVIQKDTAKQQEEQVE